MQGTVPVRIVKAIDYYVCEGQLPDDRFVCSVLENNLKKACLAANGFEIQIIPAVVNYLVGNAPTRCWGSPRAVTEWREHQGMKGVGHASQ